MYEDRREIGKQFLKSSLNSFKECEYDNKSKLFIINEGLSFHRTANFFEVKYKPHICGPNTVDWKQLEWEYLYEGLVKSADIDTAFSKLSYYETYGLIYSLNKESISSFLKNKTPLLSFYIEKHIYDLYSENADVRVAYDEMMRLINNLGYFVAYTKEVNMNIEGENIPFVYYSIHPKFIIEVTSQIYATDGILYHLTTKSNYRKITQTGLIPKNSGSYVDEYPDRVYFFKSKPVDDFAMNIKNFSEFRKEQTIADIKNTIDDFNNNKTTIQKLRYKFNHRYDYCDWVVIRVDIKKKNSYDKDDITTQYRFFDDPKSSGIFTYENIDPRCLSKISEHSLPHNEPRIEELFTPKLRELIENEEQH